MEVIVLPAQAIPQSNEGFYAINNPFQESGPKGYTEFKILENGDLFWRIDLPGVSKPNLRLSIDELKKTLKIEGIAPSLDTRDQRKYTMTCGIFCNCCEISGTNSTLCDGVLRLVVSKTLITLGATCPYRFPNGNHIIPQTTDPNDPALSGHELRPHPGLREGPTLAYESTQIGNDSVYVRIDMPGVSKENFTVSVTNGRVKVSGQAPLVSHDSAGRFYCGEVAVLSRPVDLPLNRIVTFGALGVFYLDIFPPLFSLLK